MVAQVRGRLDPRRRTRCGDQPGIALPFAHRLQRPKPLHGLNAPLIIAGGIAVPHQIKQAVALLCRVLFFKSRAIKINQRRAGKNTGSGGPLCIGHTDKMAEHRRLCPPDTDATIHLGHQPVGDLQSRCRCHAITPHIQPFDVIPIDGDGAPRILGSANDLFGQKNIGIGITPAAARTIQLRGRQRCFPRKG